MKDISKAFWFQFVPAMTLGSLTIVLLILGIIPLYYLWFTFIMWALVCGLGIAVGYHRVFSHRTHKIPIWKENVMLFFATFAGQGASIFWTALHRGYHHPHADRQEDLHSPVAHGKFNAFIGWQYKITELNNTVSMKYAVDLMKKSNHIWFHRHYLRILWGIPLIIGLINWQFALTAFCLVTMIGSIQDNMVNVFGHVKGLFSYRNFDTDDNSQNNLILGYLAWGQGWHNNHHCHPRSYDFGKGISNKWWEWDPSNIFLPFIR